MSANLPRLEPLELSLESALLRLFAVDFCFFAGTGFYIGDCFARSRGLCLLVRRLSSELDDEEEEL